MTATPLLKADQIVKRFPGVLAVDHLSLALDEGEIIGLLGQNGAGKSTLIQILAGMHPHGSYEGEITMYGRPFRPTSVAHARSLGVAYVPQEVNVVPDRSVAENMFLNAEPTRFGFVDEALCLAEARRILDEFDVRVDPSTAMGALDLATQQLMSIARALSMKARLLILDEPTAALTDAEAQRLFDRLRALRARGVTCIFVSHRLAEVFAITDRIVVMRDGCVSGQFATKPAVRDEVVHAMLGSATPAKSPGATLRAPASPSAFEVRDIVVRDPRYPRRPPVDGVSLHVAKGEVLGLFGLVGAGCSELALAMFGAWKGPVTGTIRVDGREVAIHRPADAIAQGVGLVAQDRRDSLVHEHSIADNIAMASLDANARGGFLDVTALRRLAMDYMGRLAIKAPSIDTPVGTLSGGNQQKVQVARWLASGVKVLILVDPARGIDIGARHEISALWRALSEEGCALLVVSSEAEELVELCDRVLVLRSGKCVGEIAGAQLTVENLLLAAAGA